jgi:hypothetical protein
MPALQKNTCTTASGDPSRVAIRTSARGRDRTSHSPWKNKSKQKRIDRNRETLEPRTFAVAISVARSAQNEKNALSFEHRTANASLGGAAPVSFTPLNHLKCLLFSN